MSKNFGGGFFENLFAGTGVLVNLFLVLCVIVAGPICLAYDLNHWVPVFTNKPIGLHFYNPFVLIAGWALSEIAIPIFWVTLVLVCLGIIS